MERFVLYWEQAEASPHAINATISHLREHIRTRSSRAILPGPWADKNRTRAVVEARQNYIWLNPGAEEASDDSVFGRLHAPLSPSTR